MTDQTTYRQSRPDAWGQESDAREAIASGFDAHMTKPVDMRKLGAVVDELLARRRG